MTETVARQLGIKLGEIEITRFADSECRVYVKEKINDKEVVILQSLSQIADQHLVELCLIGQACENLGAKKITAVIPWLGYSKQDKEFRSGEAISVQLIAKVIEVAGFDRVITIELHSQNVISFFKIPVTEISTHQLLAKALGNQINIEDMVVVSPDRGGRSRSELFAKSVNLPIIYLEKERNPTTGELVIGGISAALDDRSVIIFDDIINTAATAIKTSEFLKKNRAKSIFFLATHAVLAGEASQLLAASLIDRVIVADTIAIPEEKKFAKLQIISVAQLLAEAIKNKPI